MPELGLAVWAAALGITLFSGLVKGAIGLGQPLIMVSGLTMVLEPNLAVAGLLFPIVLSNLMQTFRTGIAPAIAAMKDFWRYTLIVCITIAIFAQIVPRLDPHVFYLVLGVPVMALSLIQLFGLRLHIAEKNRGWAEWVVATISGAIGGLTGTWGPTTVLYLLAIDTPKSRQVVVQGVIYGIGAVVLFVAHIKSGILNWGTAPFSAALLVPSVIGMWLGFQIQDRLDQDLFRKATLVLLTVAGLNLVYKGLSA
ncbi:sulfite exporter TauE/SafE family protein [Palleronia sp. KMU-117]|uniref:sulfite exporter TauE/SafE family protein n=1 Tax=Palleronia sp. KMU-117 TaxID=3434108 RepID=UPI003D765271